MQSDLDLNHGLASLTPARSVVRVAWSPDGRWFCTAGYDRTLCVYEAVPLPADASSGSAELDDDEFASLPRFAFPLRWKKTFSSNPEACVFLPDSQYLAFSRRDDNHLNYVRLPSPSDSAAERDYPDEAWAITRYNLNETLDSHISFCMCVRSASIPARVVRADTPEAPDYRWRSIRPSRPSHCRPTRPSLASSSCLSTPRSASAKRRIPQPSSPSSATLATPGCRAARASRYRRMTAFCASWISKGRSGRASQRTGSRRRRMRRRYLERARRAKGSGRRISLIGVAR